MSAPPTGLPRHDLRALYSDHHGWLRAWLRGRLSNPSDAADLAQDTFLRLLVGSPQTPLREPRAFLATVARGLVIDHFRRSALERAYLDELAACPDAQSPSPEQQALLLEALREVDRLLDGLSPNARTAFLLDRVDGMPQAEIAQQLGVSTRRVRQYIAQALRQCYLAAYGAAP